MTNTDLFAGLVGNLTADPELRFSRSGQPYATATITVRPYVTGATDQPDPEFVNIVAFGSLAENFATTITKGSRIVVSGRLEDDTWTGRDGVERTGRKMLADALGLDLRFVGDRSIRTAPDRDAFGLVITEIQHSEEPF